MAIPAECLPLAVRNDFSSYISLLLTEGGEINGTLLQTCEPQVCTALWGEGNPDVSGVGMIVGYIMEHALGVLLAGMAVAFAARKMNRLQKLFCGLLDRFHESAAFLCFSIQVAAIVFLIKEDAGISTAGMGDGSVRITEAVSVLTLLPLAYAVVILKPAVKGQPQEIEEDSESEAPQDRGEEDIGDMKRFGVTVICWLMAFYPFYSKMNNFFGPSEISDEPGSAISVGQFDRIVDVCLDGVDAITPNEDNLMTALIIMSYLPMTMFVLGRIVQLASRKHHRHSRFYQMAAYWLPKLPELRWVVFVLPGLIPLLGSGLIWSVSRVQQFQTQLANKMASSGDSDGQWTFGQVVAVTVFAPVFVDALFRGRQLWSSSSSADDSAIIVISGTRGKAVK